MRKVLLSSALLIIASGSIFAQDGTPKSAKDRLKEIEEKTVEGKSHKKISSKNELFELNAVSHLSLGAHKVEGSAFGSKFGPSYELSVNTFDLGFNPARWISVNAGVDLKWDRFVSKKEQIEFAGGNYSLATTAPDNINSRITTFGLGIPAMVTLHLGIANIRCGAEAVLAMNRYNKVKSKYSAAGSDFSQTTKGGEIEKFRYAYLAVIDFDGFGFFYKYCPKSLIPGSDIVKKYQTAGIVISM